MILRKRTPSTVDDTPRVRLVKWGQAPCPVCKKEGVLYKNPVTREWYVWCAPHGWVSVERRK